MEWIVSLPERLDVFLAGAAPGVSRNRAQTAIEEGRVTVNEGVVTKPAYRLQEGDAVVLEDEAPRTSAIEPVDLHLTVLYEDDVCFALDKPAGIAVHPGAGMAPSEKTLLDGIAYLFKERSLPFSEDAVLVHRLDKETTGCILIAKTREAHTALQEQFANRTVEKMYLALVAGIPQHPQAMIDAPIGRSVSKKTSMAVLGASAAREAQTTYKTLATSAARNLALLACTLHTGRTHQVRVHLSSIGHPVLGDSTYTNELSERLTQELDIRSLCLHAWKLTFRSPADQKEHAVAAPVASSFTEILRKIGIEVDLRP
jgi:23S rRNA pseudouridine1911/1915/1917 synthase